MKTPFEAPNTSQVWKVEKTFCPTHTEAQHRLRPHERYIKVAVYFSVEDPTEDDPRTTEDLLADLLKPGSGYAWKIERANVYCFSEYFCHTPSVLGMIHELECMSQGLYYQQRTDRQAIVRVLEALTHFWH